MLVGIAVSPVAVSQRPGAAAPDVTEPVLVSAAVDGAALVLTYNEALDATSTPAAGDYAVTVAGGNRSVSAVQVSGSTVTLTLASAVTQGQAVTVSYTAGVNPVQDLADNPAAALLDRVVTNETPAPSASTITYGAAEWGVPQDTVWTFNEPTQVGQFCDGTWWAVRTPTLELVSVTPVSVVASRTTNGLMKNPGNRSYVGGAVADNARGGDQGWDSIVGSGNRVPYDVALNLDPGATGVNYAITEACTLVKAVSLASPISTGRSNIDYFVPLVILDAVPPADAFPPPQSTALKAIIARESDLSYTALAIDALVGSEPTLASVATKCKLPAQMHSCNGDNARTIEAMRWVEDGYGRDYSEVTGAAANLLNLNYSNAQKRELLLGMVRWGIDVYGRLEEGGRWEDNGNLNSGRMAPLMIAALTLNHAGMLAYLNQANGPYFQESAQTFYASSREQYAVVPVFDNESGGAAQTFSILAGGTGYLVGDILRAETPARQTCGLEVVSVGGGGAVASVRVVIHPLHYVDPLPADGGLSWSGGSGSGFSGNFTRPGEVYNRAFALSGSPEWAANPIGIAGSIGGDAPNASYADAYRYNAGGSFYGLFIAAKRMPGAEMAVNWPPFFDYMQRYFSMPPTAFLPDQPDAFEQALVTAYNPAVYPAGTPAVTGGGFDGCELCLTFDRLLTEDPARIPAISDFSVTVNAASVTPTHMRVRGSTVWLYLAEVDGTASGDTASISYNAGTASVALRDISGNLAPTFNQPLTDSNEPAGSYAPVTVEDGGMGAGFTMGNLGDTSQLSFFFSFRPDLLAGSKTLHAVNGRHVFEFDQDGDLIVTLRSPSGAPAFFNQIRVLRRQILHDQWNRLLLTYDYSAGTGTADLVVTVNGAEFAQTINGASPLDYSRSVSPLAVLLSDLQSLVESANLYEGQWRDLIVAKEIIAWADLFNPDGSQKDFGADGTAVFLTQPEIFIGRTQTAADRNTGNGASGPANLGSYTATEITTRQSWSAVSSAPATPPNIVTGGGVADLNTEGFFDTDNTYLTIGFWTKVGTLIGTHTVFLIPGRTNIRRQEAALLVEVENTGGSDIANYRFDGVFSDSVLQHHAIIVDTSPGTPSLRVYVDGVEIMPSIVTTPIVSGTIDYSRIGTAVILRDAGEVADLFIDTTAALPISSLYNGGWVDLTGLGSPRVKMTGNAAAWNAGTNEGSGPNLTVAPAPPPPPFTDV